MARFLGRTKVVPSPPTPPDGAAGAGLGTFGGVFTPSILTILGLVLFLRVPFVVGSVGIVRALLILALATSVSILTSISLATVATNMKVGGGGEYFLISRTLGIEFGGAVGLVLYVAISVSIAFYAIGFAEALAGAFGSDNARLVQLIAALTVLLLMSIGLIGADLATRLQYLVLVLLVVSLVSFFIGAFGEFSQNQLTKNVGASDQGESFWATFAIFFPAVTGFSQGVAMSGDLRNPSRSITRGTFAAVGVSTVVYIAAFILLAGAEPAQVLVDKTTTIMGEISLAEPTILVGVLAATVSSALASTLGGPRVLQRLGEDHVLPRLELFAVGSGPSNNPRRATVVSAAIALATVALGDLNAIAPIISMFFLASYGMINYATYYEIQAGGTSFRPRFKWYDRRVSLAGTVACGGAIIAINPFAGAAAGLVLIGLYRYLQRREVPDRWSDSSGAFHYTQARKHLQRMAAEPFGGRDWRPCSLVFVPRDFVARQRLLSVASWIEGNVGYTTAVRLVDGSGPRRRAQAAEIEADLASELDETLPGSYARVIAADDLDVAVQTLVQSHGIGEVRANMSVFGARDLRGTEDEQRTYGQMLQSCARLRTNLAIVLADDDDWDRFENTPRDQRTIAIWWSDDQLGKLVTLLAWLCQRSEEWRQAKVVAHVPVSADHHETNRVVALLAEARITAEVVEVEPTIATMAASLGDATLVLAPLRVKRGRALGPFGTPMGTLIESLPLAIMVHASEAVELHIPRDDVLAELAQATERAAESQRRVADLDAAAAKLLVEAERLHIEADNASPAHRDQALESLNTAESAAKAAFRRYVGAKTRHDALIEKIETLDPHHVDHDLDPSVWQTAPEHR